MAVVSRTYSFGGKRPNWWSFGQVLFALAMAAALGFLIWLSWVGLGTRGEMRVAEQRAVRVAELRGTFAYLDEWLTMSAHMAAASGEPRWAARYDEAGPQLAAAIAEAVALATPEVSAALRETTDEASRGLIQMERASFAQAAAGDRDGAKSLLDSPEFAYLKAVYASGIEAFGRDLELLATTRTKTLDDRAWLETFELALGAVFLVAAFFATRGHARLQLALARTEAVACTDILTDLPNRRRLYDELQAMLARAGRSGSGMALLLLDLDRFKVINDLHGHTAGDQMLQLVAARLRAVARAGDLIARLGGDEFALAAPLDSSGQPCLHIEAVGQLAQRIVTALEQPFKLPGGLMVQVGVSIGLALAQSADEGADALVRRADVALYRAKADGRGRFCFFEPSMDARIQARALLEGELRQAIADNLIIPHFQPLVEMDTECLIGFEMLARWPHPTRGMVSPAEFISIAEDIGLIGLLTDHLLRSACCIAMTWPSETSVACNVSPLQLRDRGFPAMVRAALSASGLQPHRLELEITESALVGDLELARELLDELKALGVRLALDDFGTGYSSLRHLNMLPFDKLKIDAGFVGAMASNVESRKIVAAVIGLGQSLGLITVAEGVEEPETAALLRELGCDVGQGWLFGRPRSAEAVSALLQVAADGKHMLRSEHRETQQAAGAVPEDHHFTAPTIHEPVTTMERSCPIHASSSTLEWPTSSVVKTSEADRALQPTLLPSPLQQIKLRDLALDLIRQGLCVFNEQQRLLLFNRLYAEMYDLDPSQLWIGMTLRDVVDLRYAAGTGPGMAPEEYATWRDRIGVADQVVNTEVTLRDGRVHAIHHEPTLGGGWVATFEDITERRRAEAHVRYMAHHDGLLMPPLISLR